MLIDTSDEECAGAQVPVYNPWPGFTRGSASGGSPLENVATTWPLFTTVPQSLDSTIASGVGHPAGCAKLFTKPFCAGTSTDGVQLLARGSAIPELADDEVVGGAAPAATIKVTFTVRTAVADSE